MSTDYLRIVVLTGGINVILAVSLHLVNGLLGQFSIGHAGLMAVGAYAAAAVTLQRPSLLLALPVAMVAAALAGFIVGAPSLRLRGDYLAVVTLGFGEIIRVLLETTPSFGGALGLNGLAPLTTLPIVALAVAFTVAVAWLLQHSRYGRALTAIADDQLCAEHLGIPASRYKVATFMLAASLAGLAGALEAHHLRTISPTDFGFARSFEIAIMVVLGGLGSLWGAALAAVLLTSLAEILREVQHTLPALVHAVWPRAPDGVLAWAGKDYRMLIYALLLIVMVIVRPQGLLGKRRWRS